jgi:C-terminal processing protease CtpA/Prc
MITGCSNNNDIALQNSDQKLLVESFIEYYNKGDADSVIGLLSNDIVTEQKLGDQESKSTDVKSVHESIKHNVLWNHNIKILKWTNTNEDTISVQIEESADEYKIIGINAIQADMTFEIKDGKIIKIRTVIDKGTVDQMILKESGGIGVNIEVSQNFITINEIAPGLPADKAGLKKGDKIIAIDGINCSDMREGEGLLRLRGPVNSKVTLTISRGENEEPFDIVVERVDLSKATGN